MMNQNRFLALSASLVLIFLLSACAAKKQTEVSTEQNVVDEFIDQVQIIDAGISDADAEERAIRDAEERAREAIADANAVTVDDDAPTKGLLNASVPAGVPAYSVYFDFDKSSILPRFEEAVLAHADYLRANSQIRVEIQGNCDERGSREYNISLGDRRALAVKKALELLGVDGSRIDVTSYGSEKPRAMGHNENAWQENRRADFVY